MTIVVRVAKDFTPHPGGRTKLDGDYSADLFLEKILIPKYKEAQAADVKLLVDLDGSAGYAASFLHQVFWTLECQFPGAKDNLIFKSLEEPYLISDIREYMNGE